MKITKVDNKKFKATFKQDIKNTSVDIQTDKYLFDRNKTIGFRKDKKLFKFVGLRDGYSKQLEFSIKSVIIDGDEKISSNRVNFSGINLSGETIIHDINGVEFYNNIDLVNYKNLVKIENEFSDLDITYEVHTKGLKIGGRGYRLGSKLVHRQNELGQFLLMDEGNNNVLFKIENPVAIDEEGKFYSNIYHDLYEEGGKLYYKKTIRDNTLSIYPIFIDASITFNTSTHSNIQSYVNNNDSDLSWSSARSGGGSLYLNSYNDSINNFRVSSPYLNEWYDDSGDWEDWTTYGDYISIAIWDGLVPIPYSHTNVFDVIGGLTLEIETELTLDTGSTPILTIEEFDGITTGSTVITLDMQYNHVLSGTTTSARFKITPPADTEFQLEFAGFGYQTNVYESFIDRQFLIFDTSQLYQIAIEKMELGFTLSSPSSGEYVIQRTLTSDDNLISTLDFNNQVGSPYGTFESSGGTFLIDLGQSAIDDFVDQTVTKLVVKENEYDYLSETPTNPYIETITHNWTYELDVEVGQFVITGTTTLDFGLESNGFGVILSVDSDFGNAWSGLTSTSVAASSVSGTYDNSAAYEYDNSDHFLYRTFLNFDTSILTIYDRYVISSVKLIIKDYTYNDDIVINRGLQDTLSGLTSSEFMSFGDFYTSVEGITLDESVEIELSPDVVSVSGNTLFVIRNKDYDYDYDYNSGVGLTSSILGIDFDNTKFQIELEPYTITGIEYINVEYGKDVNLYASRNTSDGDIYWSTDSGITNILGSGNTLSINTIHYQKGDYIYAGILDISGNTISYNILSIYLDLFEYEYNTLPERNSNDHNVDIDAVYFKYHNCISGATYAYVRELDDVYEQSVEVSDGEGLGSYNMYNEWDIIDEFYSNSHEVEVVGKLDEMDLNVSYKRINDVYIHEGTRVLLYSSIPTENDGVYVADFNLKLHKTDELEDTDKAFRYKAHVGAGEFLDYEFHTISYNLSGSTSYDWADYDYFDSQIYGFEVIDMDIYGEIYFDSNIF